MGTDRVNASQQSNGTYLARTQFSMSGIWQVRVVIAISGQQTERTVFEIAVS